MAKHDFLVQVGRGKPITFREFAKLNSDDPDLCRQVLRLKSGESLRAGGGAAASATVRRLPAVKANGRAPTEAEIANYARWAEEIEAYLASEKCTHDKATRKQMRADAAMYRRWAQQSVKANGSGARQRDRGVRDFKPKFPTDAHWYDLRKAAGSRKEIGEYNKKFAMTGWGEDKLPNTADARKWARRDFNRAMESARDERRYAQLAGRVLPNGKWEGYKTWHYKVILDDNPAGERSSLHGKVDAPSAETVSDALWKLHQNLREPVGGKIVIRQPKRVEVWPDKTDSRHEAHANGSKKAEARPAKRNHEVSFLDRQPQHSIPFMAGKRTALVAFDDPGAHDVRYMHGLLWVEYDPKTLEVSSRQRVRKASGKDSPDTEWLNEEHKELLAKSHGNLARLTARKP